MNVLSRGLEGAGFRTFVPHRDGVEAHVMHLANSPLDGNFLRLRDAVDRAIFAVDVFQIVERCAALVVNVNGRVPDEGAVVEAAIAFSCNVPVVFYKHDARAPFRGRDNSMLTGLAGAPPVTRLAAIPDALRRALAEAGAPTIASQGTPLARATKLGRHLWSLLATLERVQGGPAKEDEVARQIAEWLEAQPG